MNRFNEYDYYYVEWLHSGEWIADTFHIQKGMAPEPYCEERLKQEWTHAGTGVKSKREAYRLIRLWLKDEG